MGFGGIGIWQLLIILAIVVLIFGTKRLKNIGGDLGSAMKSFRSAMGGDNEEEEESKRTREERESLGSDPEDLAHGKNAQTDKPKSSDSNRH